MVSTGRRREQQRSLTDHSRHFAGTLRQSVVCTKIGSHRFGLEPAQLLQLHAGFSEFMTRRRITIGVVAIGGE